MGELEAGAERAAGVGAGGEGLLRMRCCFAKVLSRNSNFIVFAQNSSVAKVALLVAVV